MIEKGKTMDIKKTDPEFAERFAHFAIIVRSVSKF